MRCPFVQETSPMRTPLLHRSAAGCGLLLLVLALAVLARPAGATPAAVPESAAALAPSTLCGAWCQRALYPAANGTGGPVVVAQGGRLYSMTGSNSSYSYDPATDIWTPIQGPPSGSTPSAVGDGTYIYVFAG